jgi:hypothetical protein
MMMIIVHPHHLPLQTMNAVVRPVPVDQEEKKVQRETEVVVDIEVIVVLQAIPVIQVLRDPWDPKENKDLKEKLDPQVGRVN